jgi:hypothetical protein
LLKAVGKGKEYCGTKHYPPMPRAKNPTLSRWRKRIKRFQLLQKELTHFLLEKGFDKEKLNSWLRSPAAGLDGRCPRDLLNPISINTLVRYAKKSLA